MPVVLPKTSASKTHAFTIAHLNA